MELKCIDPNGEIVLGSKLNYVEFFLNCENCIQKWSLQIIFQEDALIAQKTRLSITFS